MAKAADIIGISAPASAPVGETVIVDVSVKNISAVDQYIAVTALFDSTWVTFQFDFLLVSPGQTIVMRGNFNMPSKNARVTAYSFHWDGNTWIQDDTSYVDIALTGGITPTLNISPSSAKVNENFTYSFSGFQPNAQVSLAIAGPISTTFYKNADSSGAGSGTFYMVTGTPAGSYTLTASDSYGNIATASFTVTAAIPQPEFSGFAINEYTKV